MVVQRTLPRRPLSAFHEGVLPDRWWSKASEVFVGPPRGLFGGYLPAISSGALLGLPRGCLGVLSTAGASEVLPCLPRGEFDGSSKDVSSEAFLGLPRGRLGVVRLSEGISSRDT
jgi:hypothetical protein